MDAEACLPDNYQWHPPSPKSTPQSTKLGELFEHSFYQNSFEANGLEADFLRTPTGVQGVYGPHDQFTTPHDIHNPASAPNVDLGLARGSTSLYSKDVASELSSFPSNSFIEQFDNTNIQDSFTWSHQKGSASTPSQVRTPPPTRDSTSKRKHYQMRTQATTPSALASRRISVPNGDWLRGYTEASFTEASPFGLNTLQFSPHDASSFTIGGPITAPASNQADVFWDPAGSHNFSDVNYTIPEQDPFNADCRSLSFPIQVVPSQSGSEMPMSIKPVPTTRPNRPSSFRVASSPAVQTLSSVDPSMLFAVKTTNDIVTNTNTSRTWNPGSQGAQPYQYQMDQLKREKEQGKMRKSSRQSIRREPSISDRSGTGPRRNATESRRSSAHLNRLSQVSLSGSTGGIEGLENSYDNRNIQIARNASPLKRHRSEAQRSDSNVNQAQSHRSIVLTVDERGRAKTVITPANNVADNGREQTSSFFEDDSDSSDSIEMAAKPRNNYEDQFHDVSASGNAQSALREVLKGRAETQLSSAKKVHDSANRNRPFDSAPFPIASKEIPQRSGFRAHSSSASKAMYNSSRITPDSSTRCICGNSIGNESQLMVQCHLCSRFLHVSCLGLNPQRLPNKFCCAFCVESSPWSH